MKFGDRFEIKVDLSTARERFVNRAYNNIFYKYFHSLTPQAKLNAHRDIASALGDKYRYAQNLESLIGPDFLRNLHAIEAFYQSRSNDARLGAEIEALLPECELDIGIEWRRPFFVPKGAELLDQTLINDQLQWLRRANYQTVFEPFGKALRHLLEAHTDKGLLFDVITDAYEAVEAMAKIVTKRDLDLYTNRELFIKEVKASEAYKRLLKEYAEYAHNFRHAASERKPKPSITEREAESFVYLTGIFIRLAMPDEDRTNRGV